MEHNENQRLRLVAIREKLNLRQNAFAEKLGLKPTSYYDVEKGRNGISRKIITTLSEVFDVNPNWILNGDGTMFLSGSSHLGKNGDVLLLDINVEAGTLNDTELGGKVIDRFSLPGLTKGVYYALPINGDSMIPTFTSGDVIVVKKIDLLEFRNDEVYLVDVPGSLPVLKRIRRVSNTLYRFISDNPTVSAYEIPVTEINSFYRVIRVVKSFD